MSLAYENRVTDGHKLGDRVENSVRLLLESLQKIPANLEKLAIGFQIIVHAQSWAAND